MKRSNPRWPPCHGRCWWSPWNLKTRAPLHRSKDAKPSAHWTKCGARVSVHSFRNKHFSLRRGRVRQLHCSQDQHRNHEHCSPHWAELASQRSASAPSICAFAQHWVCWNWAQTKHRPSNKHWREASKRSVSRAMARSHASISTTQPTPRARSMTCNLPRCCSMRWKMESFGWCINRK